MKNFKKGEFVCKCCKELPDEVWMNTRALVENVLDPVRELFGKAIRVNSGYRCEKHNRKVGGARNSQHVCGEAADVCAETKGFRNIEAWKEANQDIVRLILKNGRFDQLILENVGEKDLLPAWIHVSYSRRCNRGDVLKKVVGKEGYCRLRKAEICELLGGRFFRE